MPNTEVKLFSADGSWGISPCESRTSPGKCEERVALRSYSFFVAWLNSNFKKRIIPPSLYPSTFGEVDFFIYKFYDNSKQRLDSKGWYSCKDLLVLQLISF
jgi:hypothetical protein